MGTTRGNSQSEYIRYIKFSVKVNAINPWLDFTLYTCPVLNQWHRQGGYWQTAVSKPFAIFCHYTPIKQSNTLLKQSASLHQHIAIVSLCHCV